MLLEMLFEGPQNYPQVQSFLRTNSKTIKLVVRLVTVKAYRLNCQREKAHRAESRRNQV